jgi:alkanesulfonate monooxygenase SsuD/methylene tetrahydromethanopterin reductase-like flavin-dependent oxidoreductase (luciferase family)
VIQWPPDGQLTRTETPLMKFGLFGAATAQRNNNPDVDSAAGFKDYIDYVIEAESLGYEGVFIVEHHFTGFGQVSATLNLLTWIGAKTSTIRLGTAVIVLPWHNPVLLAEQAATVDLLSGGRLDFGVGKGYRHNEFASFRIPMAEAQARFEEAVDIITKSWVSNERFDFRGKFWSFDDIVVEPPTIQHPHPPFWQGAGHPDSIRRVAARGHNLLLDQFASIEETVRRFHIYRDAMIEYGHGFEPHQAGVARAFFVANSQAEKDAAIERRMAAQRRLHDISQIPGGNNTASIMAFSDTREANEEATLFGTPDEIIRKVQRLRDQGVEYILLNGGGTSRENLRRFAREVMPHFKGEPKRQAAE